MSLGKQMIERLGQLVTEGPEAAGLRPADHGYSVLMVDDAGVTARLELFDHDRYSVTLRGLEIGPVQHGEGDARAYLSARAAEIARRMSYLEEPLAVWELDGGEKLAQLRSSPPLREGEAVSYWEVTLWAGERPGARMRRCRWVPGMVEREELAYPATFALIGRMVDSLVESMEMADK